MTQEPTPAPVTITGAIGDMTETLETLRATGHIRPKQGQRDSMTAMSTKGEEKRQRIIDAANALFYHKGFASTSFADIASTADIPKGNFYFYFRTKDALLQAVVDDRLARMGARLAGWREEEGTSPRQRLHRIVDLPASDKHEISQFGCPMGTLSAELGKNHTTNHNFLVAMYDQLLAEAEAALIEMGRSQTDAKHQARHLIVRLQGAATMAHAYHDEHWISDETKAVHEWVDTL